MARVFISFAIEDKNLRDLLIGQKRNYRNDIDFTDYSVKEPWSSSWKTRCRERIRLCKGMIGIVTRNTPSADGQLWELKCGSEEQIPTLLIHGRPNYSDRLSFLPLEIKGHSIHDWNTSNLVNFLQRL